jgi:hypothetical protein
MPARDDNRPFLRTRPGVGSYMLLLAIACVMLWGGIIAVIAIFGLIVTRAASAQPPLWVVVLFSLPPLLSGVVTTLLSRRLLGPYTSFGAATKMVLGLATGCVLAGYLAPVSLLAVACAAAYRSPLSDLTPLIALAGSAAMWLCWVVGGVSASLLIRPVRPVSQSDTSDSHP